MKILLDHCVPRPLKTYLTGHEVAHASELGWQELTNGDLLREAENAFDLMIASDQNLSYQQNLPGRKLSIVVLWTNHWLELRTEIDRIILALDQVVPGSFLVIR